MESFSENLYSEMENNLNVILHSFNDQLTFAEAAVKIIIPYIERLKVHFVNYTFRTEDEEIFFFKVIKPKFLSTLIYHNEIYRIERNRPEANPRAVRKYLNQELIKIKDFCRENEEFFKYYRTGNDCFDTVYFLRRTPDIRLSINSSYFLFDQSFSTLHDYTVAKIIANKKVENFIQQEQNTIKNPHNVLPSTNVQGLKWTGSKASLVELVYALHTEGVFNNGVSGLKEVAFFLEAIFDVNLGQYHRVFLEIRSRKNERTKFLNSLREKLLKRMEEADEF